MLVAGKRTVMHERPLSVTLIGGLLIFAGAAGLLFYHHPSPMLRAYVEVVAGTADSAAMLLAGLLVAICCGAGMLMGWGWSRLVYLGWNAVGLADRLLQSPPAINLAAWIAFGAIACVLLCGPANGWFRRGVRGRA
jgi:hypothetical protein